MLSGTLVPWSLLGIDDVEARFGCPLSPFPIAPIRLLSGGLPHGPYQVSMSSKSIWVARGPLSPCSFLGINDLEADFGRLWSPGAILWSPLGIDNLKHWGRLWSPGPVVFGRLLTGPQVPWYALGIDISHFLYTVKYIGGLFLVQHSISIRRNTCLLYTSDAADE